MPSSADSPSSRTHHYRFPLSPPSSGTVTAISSPRLSASPDVLNSIFAPLTTFPAHNSPSPPKRRRATANLSDSESHITDQSPPRRAYRKQPPPRTNRALTLPPSTSLRSTLPSPKLARPISRQSSSSSTSSSSTAPATGHERVATSGLGRKVAAKLQLFKETTMDDPAAREALESTQPATLSNQEVAEAQFEFVKRSEWPDRETAALRRERSSTALERIRTRESSYNEEQTQHRSRERKSSVRGSPGLDLHQWRKDVHQRQDIGRGRRRERGDESMRDPLVLQDTLVPPSHQFHDPSPPRTRSLAYPPSPSPSRSPRHRLPSSSRSFTTDPATISPAPPKGSIPDPTLVHSAPATFSLSNLELEIPPLSLPPAPTSPLETFSPWSTDDESTWETASATTSTSTTSAHFPTSPSAEEIPSPLVDGSSKDPTVDGGRPQDIHPHRNDTTMDLDFDWNGSEDQLPHIPLRPFRNQVGGHSAIYKFTKQAVCKPLVSRENLFYESVEREAPPLLGFIPRYLGVMLVSYRRVPKGTTSTIVSPHLGKDDPHPARPILPKSASDVLKSANVDIPCRKSPSQSRDGAAGRYTSANVDTDSDEDEMPEVVLDRNRHIIPEWMLRGGRNRSISHCPSPTPANRQLKRLQLDRGTASTPDLASTPTPSSVLHSRLSPLAQYPPYVPSELDALTPVNSPSQSTRAFLPAIGARPTVPLEKYLSDEGESMQRPTFRQFASERPSQPLWFGGTGSTMVNTRLKDHVFSTVLRRMRRRTGSRWGDSTRTEDEGDVDSAVAGHRDRRPLRKGSRKMMTQADKLRELEGESFDTATGLRRVQSESMIASPEKLEAMARECERSKERLGVVERDREYEFDRQQHQPQQHGLDEEEQNSRRSRSRSLDAVPSAGVPFHQPGFVDQGSIPEHAGLPQNDPTITRQNHFILMEDLTGRLKHPCVMDLKMGTRQYGMDATSAKKKSQRKKCDRTTSRSLGVRVCGMQVWNHVTQTYTTQDKYKGREVKPDDFDSVLASFLHNGARLLAYQIPSLLQKLYALARIIYRLRGYRFYGCSLLLIYDGDREVQEGYRSLVLENPSSRSRRGESFERRQSRSKSQTKSEKSGLRRSHSEDLLVGPIAKRSSGRRKRGEILVRIVDFAHTTTGRDWVPYPGSHDRNSHIPNPEAYSSSKGYQAEVDPETGLLYARFPPHYPDQPDRGFLSGLKSMAESLERIWNEERLRRVKAARENPTIAPLPPLQTDGKEIFHEIFGGDEDSGMIST